MTSTNSQESPNTGEVTYRRVELLRLRLPLWLTPRPCGRRRRMESWRRRLAMLPVGLLSLLNRCWRTASRSLVRIPPVGSSSSLVIGSTDSSSSWLRLARWPRGTTSPCRQEAIALWSAAVPLAGMPLDAEGTMINLGALWRLILQRHGVQETDEYVTQAPEGAESASVRPRTADDVASAVGRWGCRSVAKHHKADV